MTTEGPLNAGTAADNNASGTIAWSNPNNATGAPNATYATAILAATEYSHYLKLTNFGGAIPAGSLILGIRVRYVAKGSVPVTTGNFYARLLVAGSLYDTAGVAPPTRSLTASDATYTDGSSTELWSGAPLTDANINAVGFGIELQFHAAADAYTASVDSADVTVYYVTPKADAENLAINFDETDAVTTLVAAITSPTPAEVVTNASVPVAWSLTGGMQQVYELIVSDDAAGSNIVYDSGMVVSSDMSVSLPPGALPSGGSFWVWVWIMDSLGLETASDLVAFNTDFAPLADVTGVVVLKLGGCSTPTILPGFRVSWTQVVPTGFESFTLYGVQRRENGGAWKRIWTTTVITTTHMIDYNVKAYTVYEYAVCWQSGTSLYSAIQSPLARGYLDYDFAYLHDIASPAYFVRVDSLQAKVDPAIDVVIQRTWGRSKGTAWVGEQFDHRMSLTGLNHLRKDQHAWANLLALLERQTTGSTLCLRLGRDRELYFATLLTSPKDVGQKSWASDISLQEIEYDEAI